MLLAVESCLTSTTEAVDQLIADGMANQLLDEISLKRFMANGDTPLSISGPSSYETSGNGRERFNDLDDCKNFSARPAEGIWGETLGTGNDSGGNGKRELYASQYAVCQLAAAGRDLFCQPDQSFAKTDWLRMSYYRAVEVTIEYVRADGGVIPLAKRRRVYAYMPPPT